MTEFSEIDGREGLLRLEDQLCFSLYAATNAITRTYRPLLSQIGLTYPQYLVMLVLWQDGKSTIGHIADRLSLAQNALTPLLGRLKSAGLIVRERDADDRRIVRISLTDLGRELEEKAARAQAEVECRTLMPQDQINALRDELHRLTRQIESDESLRLSSDPGTRAGSSEPAT